MRSVDRHCSNHTRSECLLDYEALTMKNAFSRFRLKASRDCITRDYKRMRRERDSLQKRQDNTENLKLDAKPDDHHAIRERGSVSWKLHHVLNEEFGIRCRYHCHCSFNLRIAIGVWFGEQTGDAETSLLLECTIRVNCIKSIRKTRLDQEQREALDARPVSREKKDLPA
ncbi:hypothetical protein B9Z55_026536 [Caenorhabditis nigoni]|uniref:Uncharacterized protein n=1 Tax=Caenorhabditis nigoni TaxID=1611254 RepID=A0A2G5T368_9PELO|nr:hypothetical protein B9Z55_026536 [Caenorhabditis nigoni]